MENANSTAMDSSAAKANRIKSNKSGKSSQSGTSADSINWVYINGLGERCIANVTDSDILTAIQFDKTGEYLSVGDKGGRVITFRYMDLKNSRYFDYRYFSEIQSHEPEFDHLKSIELDEKINAIEFLNNNKTDSIQILTTNDRIIRLWKMQNREQRVT